MTKEEYHQLLNSEYWKGFTYSLIKERNFTCEDCGRQFMHERNKLQVHHLVYRDVKPWSYDPSELVVLCRECHERRHGINNPPLNRSNPEELSRSRIENIRVIPDERLFEFNSQHPRQPERRKKSSFKLTRSNKLRLWILLLLILVLIVILVQKGKVDSGDQQTNTLDEKGMTHKTKRSGSAATSTSHSSDQNLECTHDSVCMDDVESENDLPSTDEAVDWSEISRKQTEELARSYGVSTQGSEDEILKRISRKQTEELARSYGVSTRGSEDEILRRISRKQTKELARSYGVSTRGSEDEIMKRISRKQTEELARSYGVSTQGSEDEILKRISLKQAEELSKTYK